MWLTHKASSATTLGTLAFMIHLCRLGNALAAEPLVELVKIRTLEHVASWLGHQHPMTKGCGLKRIATHQ